MIVDYIQRLYTYNFDVNNLVIENIQELKQDYDKTITIMAHLLTAEKIWMMRLRGKDLSKQIIWPAFSLDECRTQLRENKNVYAKYLAKKNDHSLRANLIYTTSKGEKFETPIIDILMHVIVHGGYHRGQINALIRQAGGEPINTDFIHYVRYLL